MGQTQSSEDIDFSSDTDSDLLGYMAMRAEDPAMARQAWGEFYSRHNRYLYGLFKKAGYYDRLGDELYRQDLAQETFRRAFEKAETFNDRGVSDPQELRKLARGWLGAISKNLRNDQIRRSEPSMQSFDDTLAATLEAPNKQERIPSPLIQLVSEALDDALDDREREVLRALVEYYKPGEDFQGMPRGAARRFAQELNTTTANIRMIRKRAKEKVRRYVQEHQQKRRQS